MASGLGAGFLALTGLTAGAIASKKFRHSPVFPVLLGGVVGLMAAPVLGVVASGAGGVGASVGTQAASHGVTQAMAQGGAQVAAQTVAAPTFTSLVSGMSLPKSLAITTIAGAIKSHSEMRMLKKQLANQRDYLESQQRDLGITPEAIAEYNSNLAKLQDNIDKVERQIKASEEFELGISREKAERYRRGEKDRLKYDILKPVWDGNRALA